MLHCAYARSAKRLPRLAEGGRSPESSPSPAWKRRPFQGRWDRCFSGRLHWGRDGGLRSSARRDAALVLPLSRCAACNAIAARPNLGYQRKRLRTYVRDIAGERVQPSSVAPWTGETCSSRGRSLLGLDEQLWRFGMAGFPLAWPALH
jgi:hypothetical protein